MIKDLLERIALHLTQTGALNAQITIGNLSTNTESIALRLAPSGNGARFFDASRDEPVQLQALVKSANQLTAINVLDIVKDALESIDIQTYVQPNFVEQDEKGYIYTAIFQTTLHKGVN